MRVTYRAIDYHKSNIADKYAYVSVDGSYKIFEVNAKRRTIRELSVTRDELPPAIADECDKWRGQAYNQVRMEK